MSGTMNFTHPEAAAGKPAELEYLDGDYTVLRAGDYVVCAVSGVRIPLDALRYWSAELQEPYAKASIALKRMQEKGLTP